MKISIHAPVRGATQLPYLQIAYQQISIHAPRAGGDIERGVLIARYDAISIHAPRAGGDALRRFLYIRLFVISIHAPRAGGDSALRLWLYFRIHFNPRPPCGGRPTMMILTSTTMIFQSTPPVRGATFAPALTLFSGAISIHAPRAGGDVCAGVDVI